MKSWRAGKRALQAEIGGPTRSKPPPDPVPQPKWTGEEPCVTAPDKDVFHVDTPEAESEAKAYCAGCPILAECLQYSLVAVEEGIWGGTTTLEREELRA
jgi:WhiB family redox-sensing transcriptional regulator